MIRSNGVILAAAAFLPILAAAAPREAPSLDRGLSAACPFEPGDAGDCQGIGLRATADRSGRPGGAAQLDGRGAHARLTRPVDAPRFTVAAWIRPDRVDRPMVIASRIKNLPGHFQRNFELRLDPGGRLFLHVPGGAAWDGVQGQGAVAPGRWTHVAAVYDGSRAQIFLDGMRDGPPLAVAYAQSDTEVLVGARPEGGGGDGRRPTGPTWFFEGALDDVRFYDRPLSGEEIAFLVRMPAVPPAPPPPSVPPPHAGPPPAPVPPPVAGLPGGATFARWTFDGDAADSSGNGLHGVLRGPRPAEDRLGNPAGALAFRERDRQFVDLGTWAEPERLTLAAWVRPSSSRPMTIFSKHSSDHRPVDAWLELGLDGGGRVVLSLPVPGSRGRLASSRRLAPGRWTHVAATFDGDRAVIYVDGEPDVQGELRAFDGSPGPAFAGGRPEANGRRARLGTSFDGRLDDLALFRGALGPQAIQALFAPERSGPGRPGEEADDRHDLVRIDKLLARFDAVCAGRDGQGLAEVEGRVAQEIENELREQRSERDRDRVLRLRQVLQEWNGLRGHVDAVSLDRKRSILAGLSEAAWVELAEELDQDPWTGGPPRPWR
ncbi:MAG TPA: LamG domain-containing protein [Anaeromyxobacteraceae bacterium]|nr:LamG domain-containing protein [Anaeromyxobacteraceae bacterium]